MKLQLIIAALCCATAQSQTRLPEFRIAKSRSIDAKPEVSIRFANGHEDSLQLDKVEGKSKERSCNYIGRLANDEQSVAAVTGCLSKPDDKMHITLISRHSPEHLFAVDAAGNVEAIENPFDKATSEAVQPESRDNGDGNGWHLEGGDEEVNDGIEDAAHVAAAACAGGGNQCALPLAMKMKIKLGYDQSLKTKLAGLSTPQTPDAYLDEIFTHLAAHFKHPSLTTSLTVEEVSGSRLFHSGSWTAENNLGDARKENNKAGSDADLVAWFVADPNYWGVVGRAYLGTACSYFYKTSINEWRNTVAATAEVAAHELGHNIGMRHDMDHNNPSCIGIMDYTANDAVWSSCSVSDFKAHFNSKNWGTTCFDILDSNPSTTTVAPTTVAPTTVAPTTFAPTTVAPTTVAPTTVAPTTVAPTTVAPSTVSSTTAAPSTVSSTTVAPSTTTAAPNCKQTWIGDRYCDDDNNNAACQYDGGDCCNNTFRRWKKYCTECECKNGDGGGDCKCPCTKTGATTSSKCVSSWIADGYCDDVNNISGCNYDGGDCCNKSIPDWKKYCTKCKCKKCPCACA